jgi:DNA-binding MarR family transcriptional regulator
MQASTSSPAGTRELARRLLQLWKYVGRQAGGELAELLDELGLSMAQLKTLESVVALDGPPSVKDLSESLGCSLANSSRAVDALARRGLIERREDEDDRRVKRVSVTAKGRRALARIDALRTRALERYAASLDDDQRSALSRTLADLPGS